MALVQEKKLCKFPTEILLQRESLKIKECLSFFKILRRTFFLSQMKHLSKFGGYNYKGNTTIRLKELFSCEGMSEINLKGKGKKVAIIDK